MKSDNLINVSNDPVWLRQRAVLLDTLRDFEPGDEQTTKIASFLNLIQEHLGLKIDARTRELTDCNSDAILTVLARAANGNSESFFERGECKFNFSPDRDGFIVIRAEETRRISVN
jgi:hypothetical protein